MAETHDTIKGLLVEFRGYAAGMPPSYHVTMSWHDFRVMLNRFEAAHKRERGDSAKMREVMKRVHDYLGELIRDNLVDDTPRASDLADDVYDAIHGIHSTAEKSSAVGDCAKLREALVKCREIALQWQADEAAGVAGTTDKPHARSAAEAVIDMEFEINAALTAPPRNCDRFATVDEAIGAYRQTHKYMVVNVFLDWLFAQATEKEGGAK